MNIVGLGNAGCQITSKFENLPQYNTFCIDTQNKGYSTYIEVQSQNSHEDYEKNYQELNLKNITGPTTLILCGSGDISGMVLRLLEQIKNNEFRPPEVKNWGKRTEKHFEQIRLMFLIDFLIFLFGGCT